MSKFKSSGYLKTLVIAFVIIGIGVGGVAGLKLYDKLTASTPSGQGMPQGLTESDGFPGRSSESNELETGERGTMPPAEGQGFFVTEGERGSADGEGMLQIQNADALPEGSAMTVTRNEDGTLTVTPAEGGDTPAFVGQGGVTPGEGQSGFVAGEGAAIQMSRDPEEMKASMEQAVEEGRMTREEADEMLERMAVRSEAVFVRPADGEGRETQGEGTSDGTAAAPGAENESEKEGE